MNPAKKDIRRFTVWVGTWVVTKLDINLYTILQILSVTAFEKVSLQELFMNYDYKNMDHLEDNQLLLLNL